MCYFPLPNKNVTSVAYKKGITKFDCGACPECLRKRSNSWALRAVMESRYHFENCMCTLTYDDYVRDSRGNIIGEREPDRDLKVCVRDVQLFIKRVRKHYPDKKIKYIVCAEYGKRTHRAHYHVIFFGLCFEDLISYKCSKRGNQIYKSPILTKLWGHGICTVDSVNINGAVAAYCTKYCAKERCDDTFMLASQNVGFVGLIEDFNGISYMIDGHEYPIPRKVWEFYTMLNFSDMYPSMSPKYVNYNEKTYWDGSYKRSVRARKKYYQVRDSWVVYKNYIKYWSEKSLVFEALKPSVEQRIRLLDDRKYLSYKIAALRCLEVRESGVPAVAPRSNCKSAFYRYFAKRYGHLPENACHNRASDTKFIQTPLERYAFERDIRVLPENFHRNFAKRLDIPFDLL